MVAPMGCGALLAYRVPRVPSTPRIAIWRKLRTQGWPRSATGSYFAAHTLFIQSQGWSFGAIHAQIPVTASISLPAVALTAIASLLIFLAKWSVRRTLGVCAILGILTQILLLR